MTALAPLLELLPAPWTQAGDSVVARFLDVVALELEAAQEDIDRLRRSHWFPTAYRLGDLEKVDATVGVRRLPWEHDLDGFRGRSRALIDARLAGALGSSTIKEFVCDYLVRAQETLDATFVPGLPPITRWQEAYERVPADQQHRRLAFEEWPLERRRSTTLAARGNRVPYLFSWTEHNGGLDAANPRITVTGLAGGRTAVPVLANLTTGQLVGWAGVVGTGRRLVLSRGQDGNARAVFDDEVSGFVDVSEHLFSSSHFRPGHALDRRALDDHAQMIRLTRGDNDLRYLSFGFYDVAGVDHVFFAVAATEQREGAFDQTAFDQSLFPSGTVAALDVEWAEHCPATFAVRVPRAIVVENPAIAGPGSHVEVHAALQASIEELRAAGVRAQLDLVAFRDEQRQRASVRLPWVRMPPEVAPSGEGERLTLGGRYGESPLDRSRFE